MDEIDHGGYTGVDRRSATGVAVALAKIEGKIDQLVEKVSTQSEILSGKINFGDAQNAQATTLLASHVTLLEADVQRRLVITEETARMLAKSVTDTAIQLADKMSAEFEKRDNAIVAARRWGLGFAVVVLSLLVSTILTVWLRLH